MKFTVVLKIFDVDCYFDSDKILENISFTLKENEFIGILGPNGAGKTTLINTLSGGLKPRFGTVLIDEENIFTTPPKTLAQKIAVVPQSSSISFDFTVLDIVLMGRNPHLSRFDGESSQDFTIALDAMTEVGISHLANRRITQLSGGERQRVIIARALVQEPKVLFLDEPTLHLDISNQLEILDLLQNLCKKKNLLLIAVLHDLNLALKYCDRLILLHNKKIEALGSPENVLTRENIFRVFGVEAYVKHHPITNTLYVIPFSSTIHKKNKDNKLKVHIMCGGGSGAYLMKRLVDDGFTVSAGVLNILDSDYEAAQHLSIPVVLEAPFSPITEETYQSNVKQALNSDVVILSDFLIGDGNIKNIQTALTVATNEIPLIIIKPDSFSKRDFTGGQATINFKRLPTKSIFYATSYDNAIEILKNIINNKVTKRQDK